MHRRGLTFSIVDILLDRAMHSAVDCDVVVVGGGPVGLFLACELGAYGLTTALFERAATTSTHPKANTHGARSLELYRRHGLAERFRRAGWPAHRAADIAYVTRLTGHELGRVEMPSPAAALEASLADDPRWPTPEPQLRASQLVLEPILRARAQSHPHVRLHFGAEVSRVDGGEDSVVANVRQDGRSFDVRARYLVACDGARSAVRGRLGIRLAGEGGADLPFMGGMMVTTHFHAPTLLARLPHRPAWQYWVLNAERRNLVVSLDGAERFVLHHQLAPDETLASFDFARALTAVAGEQVPHRVLSSAPWRAGRALVAERYGSGRVALAGDAAHLFTPTGGLGLNTGIEDVANLAWKLCGAVNGWAGAGLLGSYERERRPVAERNTRFALSLARAVSDCPIAAELEANGPRGDAARAAARQHIEAVARNEFDHPGLQLGTRYDEARLVVDAPTEAPEARTAYVPTMSPGGRLPHLWLADGRSTLDPCGHHFTLIDFTGAGEAGAVFASAASARAIPFVALAIDRPDIVERFGARRVLVRPDQIVAWSDRSPGARGEREDADSILDTVTGHHAPGAGTFDVSTGG